MKRSLAFGVAIVGGAIGVVALAWLGFAWYESRLPETYSVMDYAIPDVGGAPAGADHMHGETSVVALHGPTGTPRRRFVLIAREGSVRLASGRSVDALSFNGSVPGPELRVREGELVEVTLRNQNIEQGVTVHWHGVDLPNAEDGVAGVTQNAVLPGESHVYRFRAGQVGTFWYHAHQASAGEVRRGLYGPLVIEPPRAPQSGARDIVVAVHTLDGTPLVNDTDGVERHVVAPGAAVRLRVINTDNAPIRFGIGGTPFRVVAIDGTDLVGPTLLREKTMVLAAGGRYDVSFTMPRTPVKLAVAGTLVGLALSTDGKADPPPPVPGPEFDPVVYGRPSPTPVDVSSHFDRVFTLDVGRKPGFLDGQPGKQWTLNGGIYPRVPMFMVAKGDRVRISIHNRTGAVHPMHLHGHHMLVLSRNGIAVSGGPWWSDTLNVEPGETYDVAFRANNPGIWMAHCHNLAHAAAGLTMHVAYTGVTTPFQTGGAAHNHPE
ncbi:MAG: multicopper oxidase family protein [Thermoleophilia bacterium]|nr:multicopper oxidase family protein [Thermoleophilia bacterium]